MPDLAAARREARHLLDFINASPSPWHATQNIADLLTRHGWQPLEESCRWNLKPEGRYFVTRGASLIAFALGEAPTQRFVMLGAHTDSPGLRLKPRAPHHSDGLLRLGVEVYGGPILATFADRDLSLAGRVHVRSTAGFTPQLVDFATPLVRLPNLAIHMNREVNEQGLKLNKQTELPLLLGVAAPDGTAESRFLDLLAARLDVDASDILTWELNAYDTQPGSLWGADQEFMASRQLDNLSSCHAAVQALLASENPSATRLCAFFDHEEVGSESNAGAGGSFISDILQRISHLQGLDAEAHRCALARSFFISADMAHAWHPNFPSAYEPCHRVMVNSGPVIKSNANQRYSTGADTAARFMTICEHAGVPVQQYAHRTDLGCGSTIGPMLAAQLGIASVDVGSPMWAMHSIRESAGVFDHAHMIAALKCALEE